MAVGFHAQTGGLHGFFCFHGFAQGHGQLLPQALAGHLENVADARLALGRLEEHPAAPVEIEDVAVASDQRGRRDDLLQERLFGQLAQGHLHGECRLGRRGAQGGCCRRH